MGIASLFSGIGALEHGLRAHLTEPLTLMCEINADARRVLATKFPGVPIHEDVSTLDRLPPDTTIVAAGSPCTNFSCAGRCEGLGGVASSLIEHVFRLVGGCDAVHTVILENVDNIVRLHAGGAAQAITSRLSALGFAWAYRVFDARAFGLPQARRRFVLVAKRGDEAPIWMLASRPWVPAWTSGAETTEADVQQSGFAGFYISEGKRGCGFRAGTVATLKSNGNGLQLRCGYQPHVLLLAEGSRTDGARLIKMHVEDAEAAQGLPRGWTQAAGIDARRFGRVGNAAPVPIMQFVAAGLSGKICAPVHLFPAPSSRGKGWATAAYGLPSGEVRFVHASAAPPDDASRFLCAVDAQPRMFEQSGEVSSNAALGFLQRAARGSPAMPPWALDVIRARALERR